MYIYISPCPTSTHLSGRGWTSILLAFLSAIAGNFDIFHVRIKIVGHTCTSSGFVPTKVSVIRRNIHVVRSRIPTRGFFEVQSLETDKTPCASTRELGNLISHVTSRRSGRSDSCDRSNGSASRLVVYVESYYAGLYLHIIALFTEHASDIKACKGPTLSGRDLPFQRLSISGERARNVTISELLLRVVTQRGSICSCPLATFSATTRLMVKSTTFCPGSFKRAWG